MKPKEIRNATIERVSLGLEDHGLLTMWLHLDYGDGNHQGFGGYNLGATPGKSYAGCFIVKCLNVAGVDDINKLPGKTIRVVIEDNLITGVGHITRNAWFYPKEEFKSEAIC